MIPKKILIQMKILKVWRIPKRKTQIPMMMEWTILIPKNLTLKRRCLQKWKLKWNLRQRKV